MWHITQNTQFYLGKNFRIPTHRPSNFLNAMPSNFNQGFLAWSLSHLQLWFRFLFARKRFRNPSPTRRLIAKSWRNSLTHLVHRNHLISTTLPSYSFILIASPACELIPSTSLISSIIPIISRDSNRIPTAYLSSHPYLIVGLKQLYPYELIYDPSFFWAPWSVNNFFTFCLLTTFDS